MTKRLISLLLALVLTLSCFPVGAYAAEAGAAAVDVVEMIPGETLPAEAETEAIEPTQPLPEETVPAAEETAPALEETVPETEPQTEPSAPGTEETAEPAYQETEAAEETADVVTVAFVCDPADLILTVTDEAGNVIAPQEDGTYSLPQGDYFYSAHRDGFLPAESVPFQAEEQMLTLAVTLDPIPVSSTATPEGYVPASSDSEDYTYLGADGRSSQPDVLLIQTTLPWKCDSNETVLKSLTDQGKIKGFKTLAIANAKGMDFSPYRLVIIANEQTDDFYDKYELIRVPIENYVASGGAVAFGACDQGWNESTFTWTLPGGVEKDNHYAYYNYVVDPKHPLVTGQYTDGTALTDSMLYNNYCSHTYFIENTLPKGARVILRDKDNDAPTLVEYPFGKGYIIASGLTWEFDYIYQYGDFGRNSLDDYYMYAYNRSNLNDGPAPIIVVPGVMGSRLFKDSSCSEDSMVWGDNNAVLDSDKQNGTAININNTLYVRGENGLFKESNTDKEYGTTDTYENLVEFLLDTYSDREIYFFSYDWRKSNVDSAAALQNALINSGINKAVFICHSMGGLVLSNYVAKYSDASIDKIVTLGTPYEGATRLMQAVLTDDVLDLGMIATPIANSALKKGGLTYDIKRKLPGVAELTPNTLYWEQANATNLCYLYTEVTDSNRALTLSGITDFKQISTLSKLRSWANSMFAKNKTEKESKAAAKSWLQTLENTYAAEGDVLIGISVTNLSGGRAKITPIKHEGYDYEKALKLIYPGYTNIAAAQKNVQAGIKLLAGMPNAYFAIGDTEKTMSGITLQVKNGTVSPQDYDYLSAGDGTVPFASANQLRGDALDRARYFKLNHSDLAGNSGSGEWKKVKNFLRSIIEDTTVSDSGRTTPKLPKGMTVIRAACPVDVTIQRGGEILSNNPDSPNYETSFGTLDLAGENGEIKVFCLDTYDDYTVRIQGTGEGEMDYSIRFYDESAELLEELAAEDIPVTDQTVMVTGTDNSEPITITVDPDGTGEHIQDYLLVNLDGSTQPLTIDQEYILLAKGQTGAVRVTAEPAVLQSQIRWLATDSDGVVPEEDPVITVDEITGGITALKEGTAYVVAYLENGSNLFSVRCRVDVTEPEEGAQDGVAGNIRNVSIPNNKVTVELYKTDYARFDVLLEMDQLLNPEAMSALVPEEDLPEAEAGGIAVEEASFVDPDTAALFDLNVVDDRTLEIIPRYSALETAQEDSSDVKSSYKSAVKVIVAGQEFVTADADGDEARLTLSVKKSLPSVKANSLSFHTALSGEEERLTFSGAKVTGIEADTQTAAKKAKKDASQWLDVDYETGAVSLKDGAAPKSSGNLYLTLTLEGWAVKKNIAVSVKTSSSSPKLSLSASSISVLPDSYDAAAVRYTIKTAAFKDMIPVITRITEGKGKTLKTYQNNQVLSVECTEDSILVSALNVPKDGKSHTYKVYLALGGKEFSLSVKVLSPTTKVTASVKASGSINTAVRNSPITLKVSLKKFHAESAKQYNVVIKQYKAGNKKSVTIDRTVTHLFNIHKQGNVITLTEATPGTLEKGYTYYAYVSADIADGRTTPEVKTKLSIKWGNSGKYPISIKLKTSGKIDTIRPGSSITVKPTFKNYYGYELQPEDLRFYRTYKAVVDGKLTTIKNEYTEAYFQVAVQDGTYQVQLKPGVTIGAGDSFKVSMEAKINGTAYTSSRYSLKLVTGKASFTATPSSIDLLRKDRYSSETIFLKTDDAELADISHVTLDSSSAKLFELTELGNNCYALSFKDNLAPISVKAGSKKSVVLNIYLEGAPEGKVSDTVKLTVRIR